MDKQKFNWNKLYKIGATIFIILVILLICHSIAVHQYLDRICGAYFSSAFRNGDIESIDRLLDDDTIITYKDKSDTYANLRDNVKEALAEDNIDTQSMNSHGYYGPDLVVNDTTPDVNITLNCLYNNIEHSMYLTIYLQSKYIFGYSIKEVVCDGELSDTNGLYKHIFFGDEMIEDSSLD